MAEFTKIMKIRKRMCNSFERCEDCPLYENPKQTNCYDFMIDGADEAEQLFLKWDKEHPAKTRLTDFLEKYPNAKIANGYPFVCCRQLGYGKDEDCDENKNCKDCWNTPLAE